MTSNVELFRAPEAKGAELVRLHLLEAEAPPLTEYPVEGSNEVEFVRYADRKAWINATQHFDGVPQAVWDFHVGGYQVAHKWLKDRKGRRLSFHDLRRYQAVVAALARTIELMDEIDDLIRQHGGFPLT